MAESVPRHIAHVDIEVVLLLKHLEQLVLHVVFREVGAKVYVAVLLDAVCARPVLLWDRTNLTVRSPGCVRNTVVPPDNTTLSRGPYD